MSYILDALNKAEKERRLGTVPTLNSQHQNYIEEKPKNILSITVVVALLLNIAIIIYYFYPQPESVPVEKVISNVTTDAVQDSIQDSSQNSLQKNVAISNVAQSSAPLNNAIKNTDLKNTDLKNNSIDSSNVAKKIIKSSPLPAAALPQKEIVPIQSARQTNSIEEGNVNTAGDEFIGGNLQKQLPIQSQNNEQIPFLIEKSASFRQSIPDIEIDVHVYSEIPSNRFVLINLKKYQEDDQIANGLLIESITEEGLVLSYRQEKFRYTMLMK